MPLRLVGITVISQLGLGMPVSYLVMVACIVGETWRRVRNHRKLGASFLWRWERSEAVHLGTTEELCVGGPIISACHADCKTLTSNQLWQSEPFSAESCLLTIPCSVGVPKYLSQTTRCLTTSSQDLVGTSARVGPSQIQPNYVTLLEESFVNPVPPEWFNLPRLHRTKVVVGAAKWWRFWWLVVWDAVLYC